MVTCCLPRFPTTSLPPSTLWRRKKRRKLAGGQGAPDLPGAAPSVLRSRAPQQRARGCRGDGAQGEWALHSCHVIPGLCSGTSSCGCQHQCGGDALELAGSLRVLTGLGSWGILASTHRDFCAHHNVKAEKKILIISVPFYIQKLRVLFLHN